MNYTRDIYHAIRKSLQNLANEFIVADCNCDVIHFNNSGFGASQDKLKKALLEDMLGIYNSGEKASDEKSNT